MRAGMSPALGRRSPMIEIYTSQMRIARLALLIAIALSAGIHTATAQPDPPEKTRALELFAESDQHYKAGEFEQAADLLRQAYDLYPEPLLLYNLARALEGLGDAEGAITQYERYLSSVSYTHLRAHETPEHL